MVAENLNSGLERARNVINVLVFHLLFDKMQICMSCSYEIAHL